MTRSFFFAALLIALAFPSQAQELFQAAPDGIGPLEPAEPHVLRSRSATLDRNQLLDSLAVGSPLILNLFPDARFEARVKSRRVAGASKFIYATLPDGGHATVFVACGIVRGEVHSPVGTFTMRSNAKGSVSIQQLDVSSLPPVDHGSLGPSRSDAWRYSDVPGLVALSDEEDEAPNEDSGPDETVDLLVVYTPAAEALEGVPVGRTTKLPGRAETEATIVAEVEKTNQALVNSGIGHRKFRLVAMERVDYVEHERSLCGGAGDLQILKDRKGAYFDPDQAVEKRGHEATSPLAPPVGSDIAHHLRSVQQHHLLTSSAFLASPTPDKARSMCRRGGRWRTMTGCSRSTQPKPTALAGGLEQGQ